MAVPPPPSAMRAFARRRSGVMLIAALMLAVVLGPELHTALDGGPLDSDCEVCAQLTRDTGPSPFLAPLRLPGAERVPDAPLAEPAPPTSDAYRSGARAPPARSC